ncbi:uncharacterized protein LOC123514883 [Portunus trituberculatus]|uniref:uncharacterized protein LOC123514883 n=1 Tax=Portunus trituberculatus TaxID=210409 RepID=UPI001E1CE83A|nr:uncharacterized protein LOC123514883 [Portunus trituberculatus]
MVEAAGDFAVEKITELANKIYDTGNIPERMVESEFIVIPEKEGAVECGKHRTAVMDEMADLEGMKMGGMNINNIRYVDDTVLIADTEEKLQKLVDQFDVGCRRVGLKINIGKTEVEWSDQEKGTTEGECEWSSQ